MARSARINEALRLEQESRTGEIPRGPCRIEDAGDGVVLLWERDGRTESARMPSNTFEAYLRHHDIVFTSW